MSAVLTRTRRPWLGRIAARVRAAYARWLIKHAEKDLAHHRAELQRALDGLPKQVDLDRAYIAALTKRLMRAVRDT